jgi:argininosuccinate lyase
MTYRDAYRTIGAKLEDGSYVPDTSKKHSHAGSIHNLCLDEIGNKFPK